MIKEWFILTNNIQEGPFSIADLKRDLRITPDTLVWKEGFPKWLPMGQVPELKAVFEDESKKNNDDDEEKEEKNEKNGHFKIKRDVIALSYEPMPDWIWLLIVIVFLMYSLYKLHAL